MIIVTVHDDTSISDSKTFTNRQKTKFAPHEKQAPQSQNTQHTNATQSSWILLDSSLITPCTTENHHACFMGEIIMIPMQQPLDYCVFLDIHR